MIKNIKIGSKSISIKEKQSLILGKFKLEDFSSEISDNLYDLIDQFEDIPLDRFIELILLKENKNSSIQRSKELLRFINAFTDKIFKNFTLIDDFSNLSNDVLMSIEYLILQKKEMDLENELHISKLQKKSSNINAKMDLLKKINEDISNNINRLKYIEEDYKKLKNKYDQIQNRIENKKEEIKDFNEKKKNSFRTINKITRALESGNKPDLKDSNTNFKKTSGSQYEKIKKLRGKAKDYQYRINSIKKEIKESKLELDEVKPNYEKLKGDYENLTEIIQRDQGKTNDLKKELENGFQDANSDLIKKDLDKIDFIKPVSQIESELNSIKIELSKIEKQNEIIPGSDFSDSFKLLNQKIQALNDTIQKQGTELSFSESMEDISETIDEFRNLERKLKEFQEIQNKFLDQINLESDFSLVINENLQKFFVKINFTRSQREKISFEGLTTPEKVFVAIIFSLSLNLLFNFNMIIFSNLNLPDKFNKRGSVYRTIRKVIPVFQKDEKLKEVPLVFLISNLEMKKPIKNIKIINLKQDEK